MVKINLTFSFIDDLFVFDPSFENLWTKIKSPE